jgi:hypothetical protein
VHHYRDALFVIDTDGHDLEADWLKERFCRYRCGDLGYSQLRSPLTGIVRLSGMIVDISAGRFDDYLRA